MQHLHICLPILNEFVNLNSLLDCLRKQSYTQYSLYACINQPEDWWDDSQKKSICIDNQKSIELLSGITDINMILIDRSSKGKGWTGKKKGVGWARKLLMDLAAEKGDRNDIIVSIDADTIYKENYFQSLINIFNEQKKITAHSNPYYHPLTGKEDLDSAILRYELYMRVFAIHMLLIENTYAFSAIGSGMAAKVSEYKRMGGLSPKQSGEDFYFIQKMRKAGEISNYNSVKVYPQARFSDRVFFGTGPAMIKGNSGDWSSYPFYPPSLFKNIQDTYQYFPKLFKEDNETPMTPFLQEILKKKDIWGPLRKNFKKQEQFINACEGLVDGLRILQYLKSSYEDIRRTDEVDLLLSLSYFSEKFSDINSVFPNLETMKNPLSLENMKLLRDILTKIEYEHRKMKSLH